MTTQRYRKFVLLLSMLPLTVVGCERGGGLFAPQLTPRVQAAVDDAYRDLLETTVAATDEFTSAHVAKLQPSGQGVATRRLHAMLVASIQAIRRTEKRLLLTELQDELPPEAARTSLREWRLHDAALATRMEEMITRRFQQTQGGYRYRLFESVHAELQSLCEERKAAWIDLLKVHQTVSSDTVAPETDAPEAGMKGDYAETVSHWLAP